MKKFTSGIILGLLLSLCVTVLAEEVKEYILKDALYPIFINEKEYNDKELPILNYEGNTYVPLAKLGDLTGVDYKWNEGKGRVEINTESVPATNKQSNNENSTIINRELSEAEAIKQYNENNEFVYGGAENEVEEPTAQEVIDAIKELQKQYLTEEELEFMQQWIGERELKNKLQILVIRNLDDITLRKNGQTLLTIPDVPRSIEGGKVYTGDDVKYQYDDEFYFQRASLRVKGILE